MTDPQLLQNYLFVASLLFGIGMLGFLSRRNMIVMFLSVEMMLQGVSIALAAFGWFHNNWQGQSLVIFIISVAACEAAISLALVMTLYHRSGSLDIAFWQSSREPGTQAFVDSALPPAEVQRREFPHLTPAGVEPRPSEQQTEYDSTHA
jgi:NADH-quinone oxidoreductase subunit K